MHELENHVEIGMFLSFFLRCDRWGIRALQGRCSAHRRAFYSFPFARAQIRGFPFSSFCCGPASRCKGISHTMRTHTENKPFFLTILRTRIAEKKFCFMQGGPSPQIRTCPKHTAVSVIGMRFHSRRHSFRPPGKSVGQERTAARSFRPEIWRPSADGMKLARCARSDSHSVRALRAVNSRPCGAGLHSNGRGSAPVLDCSFSGGADSHTMQNGSAHFARGQMRCLL